MDGLSANAILWIGTAGAVLTTVCWVPQAVRLIRHKDTHAISLTTNLAFGLGLICWLVYGLAIGNGPLIGSNAVSLIFTGIIVGMKLRYG